MALAKRHQDLIVQGDELFTQRSALLSLWQEICEHFYPERADFTVTRNLGADFADHLTTSYPIIARRELASAFSTMLRPTEKDWFAIGIRHREDLDEDSRRWLEMATGTMRRAMYARPAKFVRATKEADHDFATLGNAILSVELQTGRAGQDLLYRCWHPRDVAWCENAAGDIDTIHRKWQPTARDLMRLFPGKVHAEVVRAANETPYAKIDCRHVVVPAEGYGDIDGKAIRTPYVSLYVDVAHGHVMEERGVPASIYVIPRWQTVSGWAYGVSPAVVAALPDARLIQQMMLTILEASQKAADPPMIANKEALRSDVQLYAGGITWIDREYDERLGEAIRPLTQDKSGLPLGLEIMQDTREQIARAFFLNKLQMPQRGPEMTAYEVGQRIQEYIRNALPLFEPVEHDYNGALCEATFEVMLRAGAFGSPLDIPQGLAGADITFRFESPLHDALEAAKGQTFLEARALLEQTAALDPLAVQMVNAREALRDTLRGIKVPAKWMRSEDEMEDLERAEAEQKRVQELMATVSQGAQVAEQIGNAGQAMQGLDSAMIQGAM